MIYTAAFDPYHAAFRMLHILGRLEPGDTMEVDRLRIFDFYLLFPYKTYKITVRKSEKELRELRKRYVSNDKNPYNANHNDSRLLERLRPYQMSALWLLAAHGLIDPVALRQQRRVRVRSGELLRDVCAKLEPMGPGERDTLSWLFRCFRATPLSGEHGLKSRTHIMQTKYDDQ